MTNEKFDVNISYKNQKSLFHLMVNYNRTTTFIGKVYNNPLSLKFRLYLRVNTTSLGA